MCPFNERFAEEAAEAGYAARGPGELPVDVEPLESDVWHPGTDSPSLIELLKAALDEAAWDSFSRGSAIRRAGREGFARNVCVALGNWASESAGSVLVDALSDSSPSVRGHAAWALGEVGSPEATAALQERSESESDPWVSEEISSAIGS